MAFSLCEERAGFQMEIFFGAGGSELSRRIWAFASSLAWETGHRSWASCPGALLLSLPDRAAETKFGLRCRRRRRASSILSDHALDHEGDFVT